MKLVVRLLTEMLEVRILPGEPRLFNLNKLQSLGRAFGSRPNARDVKCKWVARKLLNGKAFPEYVSKVNWRCHKNVVARVIFATAESLLLAAYRALWPGDLIDPSVLCRIVGHFLID